ncbi:retinoic acid receptor responder protein 2 [Rhinophrynus dorsalis]
MKTVPRAWWVIPVVLAVAVVGQIPVNELSDIQKKAKDLVLEDFHNKDHIQNGFHVSSVLDATETEFPGGIFVHLLFTVKQTNCRKHHWRNQDCNAVKSPRIFNCFACFKFEYTSHHVLSQLTDCVLQRHVNTERESKRKEQCKKVEKKNENGLHLPGVFSYLKTQEQD